MSISTKDSVRCAEEYIFKKTLITDFKAQFNTEKYIKDQKNEQAKQRIEEWKAKIKLYKLNSNY